MDGRKRLKQSKLEVRYQIFVVDEAKIKLKIDAESCELGKKKKSLIEVYLESIEYLLMSNDVEY